MLRFKVHVHPGSSTPSVGGEHDGALAVHVHARAVEGSATAEVLSSLARAFGVKVRSVRVVRGNHSRTKTVEIEGDDAALRTQLERLLCTTT